MTIADRPDAPVRPPRQSLMKAWAALTWERAAALVWPAAGPIALFVALALFGAWERWGDPWRALTGLACFAIAALAVWRGLRTGPWPSRRAALRRLEEDSALTERPFEALDDAPSTSGAKPDAQTQALWRAHQDRMRAKARAARARAPRAAYAAADPLALRAVALMLVIGGALVAGSAARDRLADAFSPHALAAFGPTDGLIAWIDPPHYTQRPPLFLAHLAAGEAVDAPAGSTFVVRTTGVRRAPTLRVDAGGRRSRTPFEASGPGAFEARAIVASDARVSLSGGRGAWRVRAIPDRPPVVAFAGFEDLGPRQEVTFRYAVNDDYGATELFLEITSADGDVDEVLLESATLSSAGEARVRVDLTRHRWAGETVSLRLAARDGADQVGFSDPHDLKLPQRAFAEPLARALQHERQVLMSDDETPYAPAPPARELTAAQAAEEPALRIEGDTSGQRIDRAPASVQRARRALDLLARAPERFSTDAGVHLGLEYVAARLRLARERADILDAPDILWDLAVRAEGGELADAERALRRAQRALTDALARGADEAEIMALMKAYEEAADRYMEALAFEALADGRVGEAMEGLGGAMGGDQIAEMLKALRELTEAGATDDARRLLQALNEMLLNMQMFLTAGGGSGSFDSNPELREAFEELSDLIGEQRELMDDTQQMAEGGAQADAGASEGSSAGQGARPSAPNAPSSGSESGATDNQAGGSASRDRRDPSTRSQSGSSGDGGPPLDELADAQEELLRALDALAEAVGAAEDALRAQELARGGAPGEEAGGGEGGDDPAGRGGGGAGEALEDAERAMRGAVGALEGGDTANALAAQGYSVERLREAAEALARQALDADRAGQSNQAGQDGSAGRDPFGRQTGTGSGLGSGEDVAIPDAYDRQRARDILDALRERLEDPSRPAEEREYLRRLLDRF